MFNTGIEGETYVLFTESGSELLRVAVLSLTWLPEVT
jgi:hypothetical protein